MIGNLVVLVILWGFGVVVLVLGCCSVLCGGVGGWVLFVGKFFELFVVFVD